MQPITPSSQSQHHVAESDVDKSEDNQPPSTAFARTTTAAHGHNSPSATGEQPTDQVDTPQTDLVARTIKETQALSIRSESLPGASHLPEGQLLPAGHTYRPYFWLSHMAHRLMAQDTEQMAGMQSQVIDQLLMSERRAREDFQARFEYRPVDYRLVGYRFTSVDASGVPEKSYGVFARKPIAEGTLLGVYSGIGFLLKFSDLERDIDNWDHQRTQYLHWKYAEEVPDFMSYYRTLMAGLRGKEQTQVTISKCNLSTPTIIPSSHYVSILPDKERYTPMHFVNSANKLEDANSEICLVTIYTDSGNFHIPVFIASEEIAVGQELLSSYYADLDDNARWILGRNATEEKAQFNEVRDEYVNFIDCLNRAAPDRPRISSYVIAPTFDVKKTIRKTFSRRGAKKHRSRDIDTSGD